MPLSSVRRSLLKFWPSLTICYATINEIINNIWFISQNPYRYRNSFGRHPPSDISQWQKRSSNFYQWIYGSSTEHESGR